MPVFHPEHEPAVKGSTFAVKVIQMADEPFVINKTADGTADIGVIVDRLPEFVNPRHALMALNQDEFREQICHGVKHGGLHAARPRGACNTLLPPQALGDDTHVKEHGHAQFRGFFVDGEETFIIVSLGRGDGFQAGEPFFFQPFNFIRAFAEINEAERDIHPGVALGALKNFFFACELNFRFGTGDVHKPRLFENP